MDSVLGRQNIIFLIFFSNRIDRSSCQFNRGCFGEAKKERAGAFNKEVEIWN